MKVVLLQRDSIFTGASVGRTFYFTREKTMDLHEKPLYALRDLATRLNISSPTSHNKDELIALIENRKTEIENNRDIPAKSNLGRPRFKSTYIAIRQTDNGRLEFYDAEQPLTEKVVPEEPRVTIQKRPAAVTDEKARRALTKVKDLAESLCIAIDKALEKE